MTPKDVFVVCWRVPILWKTSPIWRHLGAGVMLDNAMRRTLKFGARRRSLVRMLWIPFAMAFVAALPSSRLFS